MNFSEINNAIQNLNTLPNVDNIFIGYSVLGTPIYAFHIGSYNGAQIIVEGAIHAREWISALLVIEMIKYYSAMPPENGGIYFVPLVNPDGVQLAIDGLGFIEDNNLKQFLLDINNQNTDFSQWKANIRAVDLNVNFDALWGEGQQNVFKPAPANFVGYSPNSEPEVQALIGLSETVNPALTLSFHSKGEVIYYGFEILTDEQIERDRLIAQEFSKLNGYIPVKTEASTGAYPDWISFNYQVPAFTIEVGNSEIPHPITAEYLPSIFNVNKDIPALALEIAKNPQFQINKLNMLATKNNIQTFKKRYFLKI